MTIIDLMKDNPGFSFIIILCFIWATERIVKSIIERNKPASAICDCCQKDSDNDMNDEEC